MKIIDIARQQKDALNEGISYIAVWTIRTKNGKSSWFSEDFFPEGGSKDDIPIFGEEQISRLSEIAEIDENAILLNGYCDSWIGSIDEPMNATQISEGIKRHYEMQNRKIADFLAGEEDENSEELTEIEIENDVENEPENSNFEPEIEPENTTETADFDTITIELPWKSCGDLTRAKENLINLINGKKTLILKALGSNGTGNLPIEFTTENMVKFEWLKLENQAENSENSAENTALTFGTIGDRNSVLTAWTEFLSAAVKFSKKANKVTATDKNVENEKFAFRCLLVKIGLKGAEFKVVRKTLLRNLSGDSAFATPESKAKWEKKYLKNNAENVQEEV
jgi:hypothetical protein